MAEIKLSIITINFNNAEGLRRTVRSVVEQTQSDFEYIVIDGNSSDGSVDVIRKYESRLAYWISEPDQGIYHAMNKGIQKATGEYLLFLNSGDYLHNDRVLEEVLPLVRDYAVVYGDGFRENSAGGVVKVVVPEKLKLEYFSGNSLFHPSSFIRRDMFAKYGLYDESYCIVADWEFFMKVIMIKDERVTKIPFAISVVEDGGISRSENSRGLLREEIGRVLNKYFPVSVITLINDHKANLDYLKTKKKSLPGKALMKLKSFFRK